MDPAVPIGVDVPGAGRFGAVVASGFVATSLGTPGAPAVSVVGGSVYEYRYQIAAVDKAGNTTAAGPLAATPANNGPISLDDDHYNEITWDAVPGACSYNVYRQFVQSGASPSSLGLIANVEACSYVDRGATGDGGKIPDGNGTGDVAAQRVSVIPEPVADGSFGKAVRVRQPDSGKYATYIDHSGQIATVAWVTVSGAHVDNGDGDIDVTPPTDVPYMVGVWSDVDGPAVVVRGRTTDDSESSCIFLALDHAGKYRFAVANDGSLRFGGPDCEAYADMRRVVL